MTDELVPQSYALDAELPEFDVDEVEEIRARDRSISLWPIAVEFEDEGELPSEIAPLRPRLHGGRDEIITIPRAPLGRGDVFHTRVFDLQNRASANTNTYRVLGTTESFDARWVVVGRLIPGIRPRPLSSFIEGPRGHRCELFVRYADDPGEDRLQAELGDSRFELGVDAKAGRYVARPIPGWSSNRHGYPLDEITNALVEQHRILGEPLPDIEAAKQRRQRQLGRRKAGSGRYLWTLTQADGHRDRDELDASSPAEALERATEQAFGGFDVGPPTKQTPTRRTWSELLGGTVLEVRPKR